MDRYGEQFASNRNLLHSVQHLALLELIDDLKNNGWIRSLNAFAK